jgi:large subunit ribosomal protein L41
MVSQLKPYVAMDVKLTEKEKNQVFGKLPQGGLSGSHYYDQQLWKRYKKPEVIATKEIQPV